MTSWFRSLTSTAVAIPFQGDAADLPVASVVDSPMASVPTTSTSATAPPTTSTAGVALTMTAECTHYPSTTTDSMVGINLQAPPAPSDTERAPVECVVVSDVSGSMSGKKMDLMRETCKLLLSEFVDRDKVGLVTFDTKVSERLPLTPMAQAAKASATKVVDSFHAGSQTNLSGGCFAGIQQLLDSRSNNSSSIKTVLLMTDGMANQGLCNANEIIPVLESMLRGSGITLHTFGYGSDHDSELLKSLSAAGNGSYYFVEGVDDIRGAFGDCLGGILSVVAQNLELVIEPVNGATISKIHHGNAFAVENGARYRVPFADLYGEEQRDVLVSLKLPASSPVADPASPEAQFLRCTLRFIDVIGKSSSMVEAAVGAVRTNCPVDPHLQAKNPRIELQASRIRVTETLETARALGELGDLASARQRVQESQAELQSAKQRCAGAAGADEMLDILDQDLEEAAEGLRDTRTYASAKHKMMNMAFEHSQQRCMTSAVVEEERFGIKTMHAKKSAYRTSAKSAVSSKFNPG